MASDNEHKRAIEANEKEIASLRELVKELTVGLSGSLDIVSNVSEYIGIDCGTMLSVETYREILSKAKEAVK